jgi:hypothetical protein
MIIIIFVVGELKLATLFISKQDLLDIKDSIKFEQ